MLASAALQVRFVAAAALARLFDAAGADPVLVPGAFPADAFPAARDACERVAAAYGISAPAVVVLDTDARNAAAVPTPGGGGLVVSRGLVDHLSEPQLEAVVAHELAHLREGHGARYLAVALGAGLLAGAVALRAENPVAGAALATLALAIGAAASAAYTRRCELEADAVAVREVTEAGTLLAALARLGGSATDTPPDGVAGFLRTHPTFPERKAALEG